MSRTKVAIIGSGPSGWTAAIYAARAKLEPVLFAGWQSGGQLMFTTDIENFPGFKEGVNGPLLMQTMREQAAHFETDVRDELVTAVDFSARPFKIWTHFPSDASAEVFEKGTAEELAELIQRIKQEPPAVEADSVIISTGASSIMLGVKGESEFFGRGVSTCAVCDSAFYRDKDTIVVGGGDSAMEDTLALTKFAKSVMVVHRRDSFRASKIMQERVLNHSKVKVIWNAQITEVVGDKQVTGVKLAITNKEGNTETKELAVNGVFIAIGHRPQTRIFAPQITLDPHGYVVTRHSFSKLGLEAAQPHLNAEGLVEFPSMTSIEGVFAAGDVVDVRYKQAITAAGQGCQAALDAERWLEGR